MQLYRSERLLSQVFFLAIVLLPEGIAPELLGLGYAVLLVIALGEAEHGADMQHEKLTFRNNIFLFHLIFVFWNLTDYYLLSLAIV